MALHKNSCTLKMLNTTDSNVNLPFNIWPWKDEKQFAWSMCKTASLQLSFWLNTKNIYILVMSKDLHIWSFGIHSVIPAQKSVTSIFHTRIFCISLPVTMTFPSSYHDLLHLILKTTRNTKCYAWCCSSKFDEKSDMKFG